MYINQCKTESSFSIHNKGRYNSKAGINVGQTHRPINDFDDHACIIQTGKIHNNYAKNRKYLQLRYITCSVTITY